MPLKLGKFFIENSYFQFETNQVLSQGGSRSSLVLKSFSSLLVFTSKQHEIAQTLIVNNRQTVRGAMGYDTLNQRVAFPLIDTAIHLANTLRILALKSNVLGEHTTWVMAAILYSRARN